MFLKNLLGILERQARFDEPFDCFSIPTMHPLFGERLKRRTILRSHRPVIRNRHANLEEF